MEGATQALQTTFNTRLQIIDGQTTTISVPDQLGALILKAAAGRIDRRPDRHLQDAAALLASLRPVRRTQTTQGVGSLKPRVAYRSPRSRPSRPTLGSPRRP
jgi:hypothetical protein